MNYENPTIGFVDAVDFDHEFNDIGCTFAHTLEDLYFRNDDTERTCLEECGVYRVEIRVVEQLTGEMVAAQIKRLKEEHETS